VIRARVCSLYLSEQINEIGSSEVSACLKSSEETGVVNLVELLLAYVQHYSSNIELLLEFGDEDVYFKSSFEVLRFSISDDVHKPFELLLTSANPEEDEFLCLEALVILGSEDEVLQNSSKRSNSNTTTNHDNGFKRRPCLVRRSVRSSDHYWWMVAAVGIVKLTSFSRPWSNSSDVKAEVVLMWGRGKGERMEEACRNSSRSNLNPCSCLVIEIRGPLKLQMEYVRRQPFHFLHLQLSTGSSSGNEFVTKVEEERSNEESVENWNLHQLGPSVHQHKGIDAEGKELVEDDEGGEEVLSEDSQTEDEQANTAQSGNVSANSSWCYEHPPVERGQVVRTPPYFCEEASQRCCWLVAIEKKLMK